MLLCCGPSYGAESDTIRLGEVVIKDNKANVQAGFMGYELDSAMINAYGHKSLGSLLQEQTGVYIKRYGNGGLSTISLRGTNASHTLVHWDGMALNSPMLGGFDFSLMPLSHFNSAGIHYGANSLTDGSGGFGGSIHIDNRVDFGKRFYFSGSQGFSSFHTFTTTAALGFGNTKFQSRTSYYLAKSKNRFHFPDINNANSGEPISIEAPFSLQSLMQEIHLKPNNKNHLYLKVWLLSGHRILPPALNSMDNSESQDDKYLRSVASWKHKLPSGYLEFKTAYFNESIGYANEIASIDDNNHVHSFKNRLSYSHILHRKWHLLLKADADYSIANSDGYAGTVKQAKLGGYANLNWYPADYLYLSFIMRQEMIDGKLSPFLPAGGVTFQPFKEQVLKLNANIARNYRYPTLNQLFWNPGGNPTLAPEKGITAEASLNYSIGNKPKTLLFNAGATIFHSRIDNWIIWIPGTEGYWYAENIREVWTAGTEENIKLTWKLKDWQFSGGLNYSYTSSTNKKTISSADASYNKQLIYVPNHKLAYQLNLTFKGYRLGYNGHYTGIRYITTDNSTYLPAFMLHDIGIGKTFKIEAVEFDFVFSVENLLNQYYFNIVNRPMPGRSFNFTISLKH